MPQSPPPVSEDEVQRSTDEDLSGDLLQVSDVKIASSVLVVHKFLLHWGR